MPERASARQKLWEEEKEEGAAARRRILLYLATKQHFIDPNLTKPYLTILVAKDLYLVNKDLYLVANLAPRGSSVF